MISDKLRHLNHLIAEIDAAYREAALRLGTADSELRILYALSCEGESRPLTDVIRESSLSKQTVNSALRRLERNGMIYLRSEGRSRRVFLTEAGVALAKNSALRLMALENAVLAEWEPEKLDGYLALTENYVNSFREKIREL